MRTPCREPRINGRPERALLAPAGHQAAPGRPLGRKTLVTELATPDLRSAVTDRIKATFVQLIPEDQWKSLVDAQIAALLKSEYQRPSEIAGLIRSEVLRLLQEKVRAELATGEYFESGTASKFVKEYVAANQEAMIAAAFSSMIQSGLEVLRGQIQSALGSAPRF